ncbi:chloride channel protein [Bartonella sp. LJL80]
MRLHYQTLRVLNWSRRKLRASESWFIVLALLVGALAGVFAVFLTSVAHMMQTYFFDLAPDERLSAHALGWQHLLILPIGGVVLAVFSYIVKARKRALTDVVEANALHGGRLSIRDSLIISGQTLISNGFGASVGLEAAYAQMGGAAGSRLGQLVNLRRSDMRILVGAGAGAAIAASFGAPLAGAFYAFEIVIGAYTLSALAPVAAAALAAVLVAQTLGAKPYIIAAVNDHSIDFLHYCLYALLGGVCALLGIALMRAVTVVESWVRAAKIPVWLRPALGGLLLMPIAALTSQALSGGHGALRVDFVSSATIGFIALIFIAKSAASIVSLGFGFRGGLFFASLFLGTLIGRLYAGGIDTLFQDNLLDSKVAALVGMAAFAASVIGGPLTMAMLVLEATRDFSLTGAVVIASLVASTIVRDHFGYSFSTWRLHLRGETIKSARDVGWVKTLTAGRMMRRETNATPDDLTIAQFRRKFPLGSTSRVVLLDQDNKYAGIVIPSNAYVEGLKDDDAIASLAETRTYTLTPEMDANAVMERFDKAATDQLAVVDQNRNVLGILSESHVRKRYAEELEIAQRAFYGEH